MRRVSAVVFGFAAITGIILGIVHHSEGGVDAITQNGANVTVSPGQVINYGDWGTHYYTIGSGSSSYVGFCVNPTKNTSAGQYPADLISSTEKKYQKIKLMIYIYTVRNSVTQPIIDRWFQTISDENTRYGYVHGVVGFINDGTTDGLSAEQINWLQDVSQELGAMIDGQEGAWQQASRYQLYGLNLNNNESLQNIMWIEAIPDGSIRIIKKDTEAAEAGSSDPQGNATFDGITFIVKLGQTEKGQCTISNGASSCTVSGLERGNYTISESAGSNTSYQVNGSSSHTATIDDSHNTVEVQFSNEIKKGSITVRKKDSKIQDGECKTTSGHSFTGITFGLYLSKNTHNPIIYNGQTYQPASEPLIANKAIGSSECEVVFEDLPIAEYFIKETSANNDYIQSDEIEYAVVNGSGNSVQVEFSNVPTSLGTVASDAEDGDHYIEARSDSVIKDVVSYCVEPNQKYAIKGTLMDKSTGNELLINGEKIESSVNINPTSSCGSATMRFAVDAKELGGKDVVVFEKLYKYRDDDNYDNENPIVRHENINDPKQTVTIISLDTEAKDGADDDKQVLANQSATIKDIVSYCVKPGQKYTIRGTLMDKDTGEPILIDGKKIEGEAEIEPTESCGTVEMLFNFDATGMEGMEVVVFERLFIFKTEISDEDSPLITHEDIEDEAQAVSIYLPLPDTGRFTVENEGGRVSGVVLTPAIIIVAISSYGFCRISGRRRVFGKK